MSLEPHDSDKQDPLSREKSVLRGRVLEARRLLETDFKFEASKRVQEFVLASPEFVRAETVALYAGLSDELSVTGIFEAAIRAGKSCLLPRCVSTSNLVFEDVRSWESLRAGAFGILEPAESEASCQLGRADLAILPGVAFDLAGGRLGRGKGYYDRALSAERTGSCHLFGVAFSIQIAAKVPTGSLDRRMDVVVTETGLARCSHSQ